MHVHPSPLDIPSPTLARSCLPHVFSGVSSFTLALEGLCLPRCVASSARCGTSKGMKRTYQHAIMKRKLRSVGMVGHTAQPMDGGGGRRIRCHFEECRNTFISPQRQRKYCCSECRKAAERMGHLRHVYVFTRVSRGCEREGCTSMFVPSNVRHRFCSASCRSKSYKQAGVLQVLRCGYCSQVISGRTRRARFCGASCRSRAHRKTINVGCALQE